MVAGFFPSFTQWSMNARIVFGSAGKYGSPLDLQNTLKIGPSAFWARSVLGEYAPSAIACHSKSAVNGPFNSRCETGGFGSNSEARMADSGPLIFRAITYGSGR